MSVVSLISLPATYAPNPNFVPPTSKMGWSNFQPISSQPDTAVQLQNPHLTLTFSGICGPRFSLSVVIFFEFFV